MEIKKVVVIGSGTMGSGIAAHLCNANIPVTLLDLKTEISEQARDKIHKSRPPLLLDKSKINNIKVGNIVDNFDEVKEADWVVEAVVERIDIKHDIYEKIFKDRKKGAIVSSNTSSIPIKVLSQHLSEEEKKDFCITHFFNPVRYMGLLEIVKNENNDLDKINSLKKFCEIELGKGAIVCNDTPGFLGNRIGVFAMQVAMTEAFKMKLSIEEADAIFGRPMGIPKTGVFGLYDLIGIDLMSDVVQSLVNILPAEDVFHHEAAQISMMTHMIKNGQTGNKKGLGFYRDADTGREVLDLKELTYGPAPRLNLTLAEKAEQQGVKHLLNDNGVHGQFAWRVLSRSLCYAASLIPEVGNSPIGIDDAMKLGYNWIKGPFELLDDIGLDYFINRLETDNVDVPAFLLEARGSSFYRVHQGELQCRLIGGQWQTIQRDEGVIRFTEKRQTIQPVNSCAVASWYDLDNIAMVEFHSKANALDAESMAILADAIDDVESNNMRGLVIHNDAQHFSCGVNLQAVRGFFRKEDMDGLDQFLAQFQQTVHRMAHIQAPVVAAPAGLSIGGGFEVVLHAKQVICHANSTMGLVESLVGVVPGGGGCKETLYRWIELLQCSEDITKASWKAFMNLGYGKTSTSPIIAKKNAMLRPNDRFLINRDRLLPDAITAINDASEQALFIRPNLSMPGATVFKEMTEWLAKNRDKGFFTPHDVVVGTEMARIVTGGEIEPGTVWSEQDLYDAERRSFIRLVSGEATRLRIETMLENGSPIRN